MPLIKALKVTEESRNSCAATFNLYADRQDRIKGDDEIIDEYMGGYIVRETYQLATFMSAETFNDLFRFVGTNNHPWTSVVERIPEEPAADDRFEDEETDEDE